jgi:carboxypeptidase Taq
MKSYLKLTEKFQRISNLQGAAGILHWDNSVMMPEGSYKDRANQLATISTICHEIITSPEVKDLLDDALANQRDLDDWARSNLRLMHREWLHSNCLPARIVEEFTKAASESEMIWRTARAQSDFKMFAPFLDKILKISREIADIKSSALGLSKYDAMLDQYDAGRRSEELDFIFGDLEKFLPSFTQNVVEMQKRQSEFSPIQGFFPIEKQKNLGLKIMNQLGFDFTKGRVDISEHPFCGGTADDIRLTTKYNESDFTSAFMGLMHETGHALYEAGLPADYRGQPVGSALGMSIHESQSLLVEYQICCSQEFLEYASPLISEQFSAKGNQFSANNLYRVYSEVQPSLIRIEADEVTYPIHVILRYKIERALIEGSLEVSEIPEIWNKYMKEMLGVQVDSDKNGCLQDIHWSDGSFGYFPSYTLGAMTAAQLFAAAKKQNPKISEEIRNGNFAPIISWLRENVHSKGSLYTPNELLEKATGEKLNPEIFKNYLKNKYLG